AVEDARERIAAALGAHPTEVLFTAGATEANNLAIKGWFWGAGGEPAAIITTAVEHHSALDPGRWLAREQRARLSEVGTGPDARISTEDVATMLDEVLDSGDGMRALISVQWV